MRNFQRSSRHDLVVGKLATDSHKKSGQPIFQSRRDLMCFAAVLGWESKRRNVVKEPSIEFVEYRVFERSPQAQELLYLIGLAETRNPDCLRPEAEDALVTLFEEFADGGLEILLEWLNETPSDGPGDRAILEALGKYGYLQQTDKPPEAIASDVVF